MPYHKPGISTIVVHHAEENQALNAHSSPIYQTSAFRFPDAETGAAIFQNEDILMDLSQALDQIK